MEPVVAGGDDKQFHVDKDQVKTVKAKLNEIKAGERIKIKWGGRGRVEIHEAETALYLQWG